MQPARLYLLDLTTAILLFAAGWCMVEILLHYSDDVLFTIQVAIIALMLSPALGFVAIKRAHRVDSSFFDPRPPKKYKGRVLALQIKNWFARQSQVAVTCASCIACNLLINLIFTAFKKFTGYQIQPIEQYLFYACIAVAEEVTFRVLIVSIVIALLSLVTKNLHAQVIIAAITSGVLFMLCHLGVYGSEPITMASVACAGFAMACFYGYTKNPLPNILAHLINNLIAAGFVFAVAAILII
jgi:membrane protease YdiL (CAAX protease family)